MPELPEVETVRRQIAPYVINQTIVAAWAKIERCTLPSIAGFTQRLSGQRIVAACRRGKQIYFPLQNNDHLLIHLGMSGRLFVQKSTFTRDDSPRHIQAALSLGDGQQLLFEDPRTFGKVGVSRDLPFLQNLGPEPLDDDFDVDAVAKNLQMRRTKIKTALLDQSIIAGLGNIYADEACFAARIHPAQIAATISLRKLRDLCRTLRPILERAIVARGATLKDKGYQDIFGQYGAFIPDIYGRESEPCNRCGTLIRKGKLGAGKSARSYHFCPECQRQY